ncbi:MAG: hypothetical protein PHH32_04110, partial [Eubacteriales bacterium]|nr:hypothetical protein [Eubacteriales bacterium]
MRTADLMGASRAVRDWNPPAIASFYALFGYLYCMLAAPALALHPVVGGALYLVGQVTILSIHMNRPERRQY